MTENEQRAERAYRTILVYAQYIADEYSVEWETTIERSQRHYNAETEEVAL